MGVFYVAALVTVTFCWSVFFVVLRLLGVSQMKRQQFGQVWGKWILKIAKIQLIVRGEELLKTYPSLVMCNHASLFDVPILLATLTPPFVLLPKKELFAVPVFGWGMRALGYIPVDREKKQKVFALFSAVQACVRQSCSVVIFPEGTRSIDGITQPLKKGPFLLAKHSKVPITPITLIGSHTLIPKKQVFKFRPGTVTIIIHPPIPHTEPIKTLIQKTQDALDQQRSLQKPLLKDHT